MLGTAISGIERRAPMASAVAALGHKKGWRLVASIDNGAVVPGLEAAVVRAFGGVGDASVDVVEG
jgi:hypothetical protein